MCVADEDCNCRGTVVATTFNNRCGYVDSFASSTRGQRPTDGPEAVHCLMDLRGQTAPMSSDLCAASGPIVCDINSCAGTDGRTRKDRLRNCEDHVRLNSASSRTSRTASGHRADRRCKRGRRGDHHAADAKYRKDMPVKDSRANAPLANSAVGSYVAALPHVTRQERP